MTREQAIRRLRARAHGLYARGQIDRSTFAVVLVKPARIRRNTIVQVYSWLAFDWVDIAVIRPAGTYKSPSS